MSRLPRERAMAKKRRSVRLGKAGKPPVSRKLKTKADAIDQAYFEAKRGRDSFGYLMRQTNRYFVRTLQMLIEHHGITTAQWYFLRVLWEQDGLSQVELSSRVGLTTPTT